MEDTGGFRSALTRLSSPLFAGVFDDLSYSTLWGWFEKHSLTGKKKLRKEIYDRWKGITSRCKPDGSGKKSMLDDEFEIIEEIRNSLADLRSTSTVVNSLVVASVFKSVVGIRKPELMEHMKFSRCWCRRWVQKCMGWTYKKGTTAGQKLPVDWQDLVETSIMRAASVCASFRISHSSLVINWDQTALLLMPTHNRTYHSKKDKHVKVVGLEDKRQITAVTASSMNGDLLPIQLIYAGQDHNHKEKKAVPNDKETVCLVNKHKWKLEQTNNHWSSQYTMQQYVNTIVHPYIRSQIDANQLPNDSHALLIIDCWSVHKSKEFMEWMKLHYPNYHIIFVPAGCTGVAQPADVILQRPLKHEYKNQYTNWATEQMMESLKAGVKPSNCSLLKDYRALKPLTVKWAVEAWLKLKQKKSDIALGWEKIGWNRMFDKDYQIEALTTLNKNAETSTNESKQEVEENILCQDEDEEEEDQENEQVADSDEDERVELTLARCIQNAEQTSDRRRSTRKSTYTDAHLARLLHEQDVEDFCILDD